MNLKVIKTHREYKKALTLLEEILIRDPKPKSPEGENLELLTLLIEYYETNTFPKSLPDPIDAILFRMEQQNLRQVDLIPFIGSKSKVSEILSRKRPLTLTMMKALHVGLGIPANVLLNQEKPLDSHYSSPAMPSFRVHETKGDKV